MQLGGCLSRLISLNCFCESASPGPPQIPLPGAKGKVDRAVHPRLGS